MSMKAEVSHDGEPRTTTASESWLKAVWPKRAGHASVLHSARHAALENSMSLFHCLLHVKPIYEAVEFEGVVGEKVCEGNKNKIKSLRSLS